MSVLSAHVSAHHVCVVPEEVKRECCMSWNWSKERNLSLLEDSHLSSPQCLFKGKLRDAICTIHTASPISVFG